MGDKYKWRDDKKADSMSRLEEVSSELCGIDIKWNNKMDEAAKNCTPKGKEERGQHNTIQMGHTYFGLMTSVERKEN